MKALSPSGTSARVWPPPCVLLGWPRAFATPEGRAGSLSHRCRGPIPHIQDVAGTPREEFCLDVASEWPSAKPLAPCGTWRALARSLPTGRHRRTTLHTTNAIIYFDVFPKIKTFQTQLRYKIQHKMRFIPISHIKQKITQKLFCQNQLIDCVFRSSQGCLPRPRH